MSMTSEFFTAFLTAPLEESGKYITLTKEATSDLASILKDSGSYIYLTLRDDANIETVRAHLEQGILIVDRGLSGTEAVKHPIGTCVSSVSPTVIAVIKDLICNYDCCESGDCPKTPAEFLSVYTPSGSTGTAYRGTIDFTGTDPVQVTVSGAPDWLTVTRTGSSLILSGTPASSGDVTFSIALTNLNGTKTAVKTITFSIG